VLSTVEQPGLRRRLVQLEGCIITKVDVQSEDQTSQEEWRCELQSADAEQAGVQFVALEGLENFDFDKEGIVSGLTTLLAEGAMIVDGTLKILKGSEKFWGKIERRGPAEKTKQQKEKKKNKDRKQSRLLAPSEPNYRSVLAVRVVATDSTTSADLQTLSDDIFGTNGSAVNLRERFESCSYGEIQMLPYNGMTPSGISIQDGVVEVEISDAVTGGFNRGIETAVLSELSTHLGISDLAAEFDHVMLCLPPGTSGNWIAYGACRLLLREVLQALSRCLHSLSRLLLRLLALMAHGIQQQLVPVSICSGS
jgi:hypothetical protein